MSAYGAITVSSTSATPLSTTLWPTKSHSATTPSYLTLHHLNHARALALPGLIECMHSAFAQIIEDGATYPQETLQGEQYTRDAFDAYFLAGDVILGITGSNTSLSEIAAGGPVQVDIETARAGRSWEDSVAGFYYVKPNYPGRSSHICNGGFVVPSRHQGSGFGTVLAKSFLHYAPALGYQASVFNLVYVNNAASVRLWEGLGFEKAGRIPQAGRLKRADGQGEEYVDAWVFYKSFINSVSTS